jgi:CRP-like cAMP-binding protein
MTTDPTHPAAAAAAPDTALDAAVRASRLGAGLSPAQATVLAGLLRLVSFAPNQLIAREGAADNQLYEVVDGTLGVVAHWGTPDETLIATLHTGDFAHELGFLDGAQRHATLVATSQAQVLVLTREQLETLIDTDAQILYRVMCAIVKTVHRVQTRLAVQAVELTNYIVKQHGRY